MTVLVCGSRRWGATDPIHRELNRLLARETSLWVVQGRARGADTIAYKWARYYGQVPWSFPVTEEDWAAKGKGAGPARNELMLVKAKPELVLAFTTNLSGSRGTADMVRRARAAGVPVQIYSD
jgi:hypothetical protein